MEENAAVNAVNEAAAGTFQVRTDLALEQRESSMGEGGDVSGVRRKEWHHQKSGLKLTEVKILNEQGAKSMGKPRGTYLTLEADRLSKADDDYHSEISEELAHQIRRLMAEMIGYREEDLPSVLVVGLGNDSVTPDSLGPRVLDNLQVTRHLDGQYGNTFLRDRKLPAVSGIAPGVMAQTGMETQEIIHSIVKETKPDLVLVVDALAARSTKRLNRTFQISDAGIYPGSGVGNHRNALTGESLGVPVLAIGVPTVVDAATIVGDALREMERENDSALLQNREHPQALSGLNNMYVTGKDIDETILYLSEIVSDGINRALNPEG